MISLRSLPRHCQRGMCTSISSATFPVPPYKLHKLDEAPASEVTCTRDEALGMYRSMNVIRRLETSANALYKEKAIRGFCHLYAGQEAVCVGIDSAITREDAVITAYRAHGWTYIRGASLIAVLAELTGRSSGCSRGKGGSMHMYGPKFYGGNGIVGAQIPLGAGLALAQKYLNDGQITVALAGDGAANQGQVFEAYNMAKLWHLPVMFVVENNGYGMGTSASRSSASVEYYTRGDYIPGVWVDGMDVLAVRQATHHLAQLCRAGKGPFVLEAATYRYHGHSVSDPGTSYRTREEVQEMRRKHDPITSFREKIIQSALCTPEELKTIDQEAKREVDQAASQAKNEPELSVEQLYGDIYVNCLEPEIRGTTPFDWHQHLNQSQPTN